MKVNRAASINYTMDEEGGWNPNDPSNCGITLAMYKWCCMELKLPVPTIFDLQKLTHDQIVTFYNWLCDKIGFDDLEAGVDYCALDAATNEGLSGLNAILLLTHVLTDIKARIQAFSDVRLAVKKLRPEWGKYGAGWGGRIGTRVPQRALAMVNSHG